jgi:hypothetical protein
MRIEWILLADSVQKVNGKLFMLGGGWREFRSPSFPSVARIGVAVSVLLTAEEAKKPHLVKIIYSQKGLSLPPPPGTQTAALQIQAQIAPISITTDRLQRSIVAINGAFPVMRAAEYEIAVVADGKEDDKKTVDFEAITAVTAAPNLVN